MRGHRNRWATRMAAALAVASSLVVSVAGVSVAGVVSNPPNTSPDQFWTTCNGEPLTSACIAGDLAVFDRARAAEHLAPMTLPSNFTQLDVPKQLFVLTNIDRVDRGLAPMMGLSSVLDADAQAGADNGTDPSDPSTYYGWGSNWSGDQNPLASEFMWMYDDGPGGINEDCTSPTAAGCWGHRDNILGSWSSPALMGAAVGSTGDTQLFVGTDTSDTADVMTWASEVAFFPVGVSTQQVMVRQGSTVGSLQVWASGLPMSTTATVSAGGDSWSVSPSSCTLAAGSACTLTVTHLGNSREPGTLTVTGPNGPVTVALAMAPPKPPAAPREPNARVRGHAITITWTQPADQGAAITKFQVSVTGRGIYTVAGCRHQLVLKKFRSRTHLIRVRAINAVGVGAWSRARMVHLRA